MLTYQHQEKSYSVLLKRLADGSYQATINGREVALTAQSIPGGWLLTFPESGARKTVYVEAEADTRFIGYEGETYTLTRETQRQGRRSTSRGLQGGGVTAQMPGQVREVMVAEGDTVPKGQTLVVLEAMKMELRATAPAEGVVRRVLVAVGDVVTRGQVLVEIE
jgi:biotin carboxyl carrier protein